MTDPRGPPASGQTSAFRERHQSGGDIMLQTMTSCVTSFTCIIELNGCFLIDKSYLSLGSFSFPRCVCWGPGSEGKPNGCGENIKQSRACCVRGQCWVRKTQWTENYFFSILPFAYPSLSCRLPRVRTLVSKSSQQTGHPRLMNVVQEFVERQTIFQRCQF